MNVTPISAVYGDWWQKYGDQYCETLLSAGCKHAALVSDKKFQVPDYVELIVKPFTNSADFMNTANQAVQTDWSLWFGFDDLLLGNAMDQIDTEADIYAFPFQMSGLRQGIAKYLGDFPKTYRLGYNPMAGGYAVRKRLLDEIPFRSAIYIDWIFFCEASYFQKTLFASDVPRYDWVRREESLSISPHREAHNEVYDFQKKLQAGLIQKGVPE